MMTACGWIGLTNFCGDVVDFFTSPAWYWGMWWFGILVVSWVLGWFFQSLRPYVGVVVLVTSFGLFALIYGMKIGKARERARRPAPRPAPQPLPKIPFDWLWEWR